MRLKILISNIKDDDSLTLSYIKYEFAKFKNVFDQCNNIQSELFKIKTTDSQLLNLNDLQNFIKKNHINKIEDFISNGDLASTYCRKIQLELTKLGPSKYFDFEKKNELNCFIIEQELEDHNIKEQKLKNKKLNFFYKELLINQLIALDSQIEMLQYLQYTTNLVNVKI